MLKSSLLVAHDMIDIILEKGAERLYQETYLEKKIPDFSIQHSFQLSEEIVGMNIIEYDPRHEVKDRRFDEEDEEPQPVVIEAWISQRMNKY